MTKMIHPLAGGLAFLMVATFWLSTVIVELVGTVSQIVTVKTAIPYGLLLLIPAMAVTGVTGIRQASGCRTGVIGAKSRRMRLIAANGLLLLVPSALFLSSKAQSGAFDTAFYAVQSVELAAGAVNLFLLGWSIRDGLRLAGGPSQRSVQG